jgi:oligopeptide/dipeptide ABC transporter ATP-binding protein
VPQPLLEVRNVTQIYGGGFLKGKKEAVALRDFSLVVQEEPATITTIAGESGSGKTTLASAILGFITPTSGEVLYRGQNISEMNKRERLGYRQEVQAIFQDPYEVYNPFYRIHHTFDQVIKRFKLTGAKGSARDRIEDALKLVGLRGDEVLEKYPHQLSGGQRQRIMIARAYLLRPRLMVADEPVSMVDASLRAMILDIMMRMRDEYGISFLYITHDLSTAYQIGDEIFILYSGTIAERGETTRVINDPKHPYVQLLVSSVPVPDPSVRWGEIDLPSEEGAAADTSSGCLYYPRCPHRMDRCLEAHPPLFSVDGPEHEASCYLYESPSQAELQEEVKQS